MVHIEIRDTGVVRVNKGDWVSVPRHEFLLLKLLVSKPRTMISFFDLQKDLWDIQDESETPLLAQTRSRLMRILRSLKQDVNWENIVYRDRSSGYRLPPNINQGSDGPKPVSWVAYRHAFAGCVCSLALTKPR